MTKDHPENDSLERSMNSAAKASDSSAFMEELLLIREKYKSLWQRKLYCIYVHDFEGNFLEANDTALELLGYKRDEIRTLNLADLVEGDYLATARDVIEEIKANGCQQSFTEFKLKKRDGGHVSPRQDRDTG